MENLFLQNLRKETINRFTFIQTKFMQITKQHKCNIGRIALMVHSINQVITRTSISK